MIIAFRDSLRAERWAGISLSRMYPLTAVSSVTAVAKAEITMMIRVASGIEVVAGCVELLPVPTATDDSTPDRMNEIGARIRRKIRAHLRLFLMPFLFHPTLENSDLMPPLLSLFSYIQTTRNRNRRIGTYSRNWPAMKVSHIEAVRTEGSCEAELSRPTKKDVRAQYDNMKSQTTMGPFFLEWSGVFLASGLNSLNQPLLYDAGR